MKQTQVEPIKAIIKKSRLATELEIMKRLHNISTRFVSENGSQDLLREIVETAVVITDADMGNIQLLNEQSGLLKIVANSGFKQPFLDFFNTVRLGQAACGAAMERNERVIIEDVTQSPIFAGTPSLDVMLAAGARAVQSTPLYSRSGRLVGMLSTHYLTSRRPDEQDLQLLDLLARQSADIIERMQAEQALRESEGRYRSLAGELLQEMEGRRLFSELIGFNDPPKTLAIAISIIRNLTQCEAIAIRLENGGDYPYFIWDGFSDEFIKKENSLCIKDETGCRVVQPNGQYLLECMCGNIVTGRFDLSLPFFTPGGSFWSNNTSELLLTITEEEWQGGNRNYCNFCGYESVSLIPIHVNKDIIGLLQLNDKRKNMFNRELIGYLEVLCERIGVAVSQWLIKQKLENTMDELRGEMAERKIAEQKLACTHAQMNKILDRVTDGFFALDNEWRYTYVNSIAGRYSFIGKDEMLGQCYWDLFPKAQPYYDEYHKAKKENIAVHFEAIGPGANSWVEVNAYPSSEGLSVFFRDITERKQTEAEIKQRGQEYRTLIENCPIGMTRFDKNLRHIYFNPACYVFWGDTTQQLLGKTWDEAGIPREHFISMERKLKKVLQTGQEQIFDANYPNEHGMMRYYRNRAIAERDKFGQVETILVISQDITEQKQSEKRLEDRFYKAFHMNPNMMVIMSLDGILIEVNERFTEAIGCSHHKAIGKTTKDLDICIDVQEKERLIAQFKHEGRLRNWEVQYVTKSKELRSAIISSDLIELGNTPCCLAVMTDITEQKQMEVEMARFDRLNLVGEMAAGIGHEVRNPMTTVRGYLQMFQRRDKFAEYREQLDTMIGELDRANAIIKEFLSLAKNKRVKLELGNMNSTIHALFPLLQAEAFHLGHEIQMEIGEIPSICYDDGEIRQLILNLVRNGLEAMESGGIITIKTYLDKDKIILTVQDTGMGISKEVLDKIGTPFITTKEGGTGLGLSVCYRIAERHKAKIEIDSSNQGTTFFVQFMAVKNL